MSVLTDLLGAIIERLDTDDQPTLLSLLGSLDSDRVDQYLLDETVTTHESALDDGADGITFTTVRRSRPSSVFLAWEGVQGVSGHGYYEIQFSTSASEAGVVYTAQQQSTWHITDALAYGTTYHVRGRAVDAAGHVGAWGSWQSLTSLQTVTDDYEDESVTDAKIESLTVGKLTAGTISSQEIVIAGGTAGIIRSSNFSAGSAGWRIRGDGSAEFNNVTVRGEIIATSGEITGNLTVSGSFRLSGTGEIRTSTGSSYISLDGGSSSTMAFVEGGTSYGLLYTDQPGATIDTFLWSRNTLTIESLNGGLLMVGSIVTMAIGTGDTLTINDEGSNVSIGLTGTGGRVKFLTASNTVQIRNGGDSAYGDLWLDGIQHGRSSGSSAGLSFFGAGGSPSKQTVTGAKGGNAALASLLSALAAYNLITDNST